MSLIDEALKRARQEAAVQDAAQREAQFRRVPVYAPPPRRSSGNGLLVAGAGIVAGAILVLAVAFLAGWLPAGKGNGNGEPRPAAAPAPVEVQAATAPTPAPPAAAAPRIVEGTEAPRMTPPQETPPVEPRPRTLAQETPAPVPPARPVTVPPSPPPAPAPAPTAAAPVPEPAAPPAETAEVLSAEPVSRTYVREVPVPGGTTSVVLSGIAFSAERPVALLNGRPMVPGESIEGFTVVTIEPGGVRLDGHGQKVFVSLH